MSSYLVRRVGSLAFVLFSLTFLTFLVGRLAPGDPIERIMGNRHDPVRYQELLHQYGLDQPLWQQYLSYMGGLLHGDLGLSYQYPGRSVSEILARGVPVSFSLGLVALVISVLIGVPVGIVASLHRNKPLDRLLMGLMLALFSIPSFVLVPVLRLLNLQLFNMG